MVNDPESPIDDDHPIVNPFQPQNRTPSPGRPLDPYQYDNSGYEHRQNLQMPSSDRLAAQPTVSDSRSD